jgi:hypothetical protein
MRILPVLLVSAWLAPSVAHAQFITGRIVDEATRSPVTGVELTLFDSGQHSRATALSDSAGRFRIQTPGPGTYTLHARHIAYTELASEEIIVNRNETVDLELTLGRTVIPLRPVVVTARTVDLGKMAGFHERRRTQTFGRFLTRADIERRSASRTTDLLRTMPGVTISGVRVRGRAATERSLVLVRGGSGRQCEPALFIDGVRVRQAAEAGVDDMLAPDVLEGVEVYTSTAGAPAQFMDPSACGVLLFWTREGEPGAKFSWKRLLVAAGGVAALIFFIR